MTLTSGAIDIRSVVKRDIDQSSSPVVGANVELSVFRTLTNTVVYYTTTDSIGNFSFLEQFRFIAGTSFLGMTLTVSSNIEDIRYFSPSPVSFSDLNQHIIEIIANPIKGAFICYGNVKDNDGNNISNVKIEMKSISTFTIIDTTYTDVNGNYYSYGFGNYYNINVIPIIPSSGYSSISPESIALQIKGIAYNNKNFILQKEVIVEPLNKFICSGYVYDNGEGVSGIEIKMTTSVTPMVLNSTVTTSDGSYYIFGETSETQVSIIPTVPIGYDEISPTGLIIYNDNSTRVQNFSLLFCPQESDKILLPFCSPLLKLLSRL